MDGHAAGTVFGFLIERRCRLYLRMLMSCLLFFSVVILL
jgi:hypothetical protein